MSATLFAISMIACTPDLLICREHEIDSAVYSSLSDCQGALEFKNYHREYPPGARVLAKCMQVSDEMTWAMSWTGELLTNDLNVSPAELTVKGVAAAVENADLTTPLEKPESIAKNITRSSPTDKISRVSVSYASAVGIIRTTFDVPTHKN